MHERPADKPVPVEFDLGRAAGGPEEELLERVPPSWLGTPLCRWLAAGLAATLLIGGLAARVATRHRGASAALAATSTAQPAPIPTPTPTATANSFRPARGPGVAPNPTSCPSSFTCVTRRTLPAAFLAAVRGRFPAADALYQLDVTRADPPGVLFRQLNASYGTTDVAILVFPFRIGMPGRSTDGIVHASDRTIGFVWEVADGYVVQVQFTGPQGWRPTIAELHSLAADPRLRAVG